MDSDDMLYGDFLAGNNTAYDKLMIRHGDALIMYLNGYLHCPEDAEDLMIEAFARIMVKKPSIGNGAFKAYLYKTARNLASRFHAKKMRMETFSLDDFENMISREGKTPAGMIKTPEAETEKAEKKRALYRCLDSIDPELREALWLVYCEDLSYAQTAEVMKVNRKRVDKLLQRGKEKLRAELAKEGIKDAYE